MIPTLFDIIRGLLNGTMSHEEANRYLIAHLALQEEADSLQVDSYELAQSLVDAIKKCNEQDKRWGPRQYPSFHPPMLASADTTVAGMASIHGVMGPTIARLQTQVRDGDGELSWMDILMEEAAKLCEKYEDEKALRDQVIDVAGVAIQWAAQLTKASRAVVVEDEHGDRVLHIEEADHEGPNLR